VFAEFSAPYWPRWQIIIINIDYKKIHFVNGREIILPDNLLVRGVVLSNKIGIFLENKLGEWAVIQNVMVQHREEPNEVERMAAKLIKSLGVEGALSCCRENHWDGVLKAILTHLRGRDI